MERRGRFIQYDKQQVLQDIADGKMSASSIAEKHKITRDMVYTLKFTAKKKHILRETSPKLDDLDPIDIKKVRPTAHEVYLLAEDYAQGKISGASLFKKLTEII